MPLSPNDLEVHSKHFLDGLPLCWDQDAEIILFEASYEDGEVTCSKCLKFLQED